jgi:hypothetical protein
MDTRDQDSAALEKMGRVFALLFGHLARAAVARCGPEGRQAIIDGVMSFGRHRGRMIRDQVLAQGLLLTIENFYANHDLAHVNAGFDMTLACRDWGGEALVTRCPFADVWREMQEPELGAIYCLVDVAMLEGYNPDLTLVRPTTILGGQPSCQFLWHPKEAVNAPNH